ncbi:hypothetical protein [Mycolicibacterium lutetiense]
MSQPDENHPPAVPTPTPPSRPLLPDLSPPPGYVSATGANPYPYSAPPPVQTNRYAPHAASKSPGLAALLAGLFGCLGMLYATVPGAFITFGINVLLFFIGIFTVGIAWFFLVFTWIGGMVWAYVAAQEHNRKLLPPAFPPQSPY